MGKTIIGEEAFSKIKAYIRRHGEDFSGSNELLYDLYVCQQLITREDAAGYFRNGGY